MAQTKRKAGILLKQLIMRKVILALLPCVAGSVYFFGWRSLGIVLLSAATGFAAEYVFARRWKEPVSEAVFVTTTIFALIMPPTVAWHVVIIGVAFAVVFAKCVFGGFGRNVFNPAMAGRCFVYICFPVALTAMWAPPAEGPWGAIDRWTTAPTADAITGATVMAHIKAGKVTLSSEEDALDEVSLDITEDQTAAVKRSVLFDGLLFGRIGGTMGVTSVLLILIGGIYVFYAKVASRTIILSVIITYSALNAILYWFGVRPVTEAWAAVMGGGFLFGAFFMATDPVSAPREETAKIIFGAIIGVCTVVIRNFSIFNGGMMFSILIGNMFAPILDQAVKMYKNRGKLPAEAGK